MIYSGTPGPAVLHERRREGRNPPGPLIFFFLNGFQFDISPLTSGAFTRKIGPFLQRQADRDKCASSPWESPFSRVAFGSGSLPTTLSGTMFSCLLTQIARQPITRRQVITLRTLRAYIDIVKRGFTLLFFLISPQKQHKLSRKRCILSPLFTTTWQKKFC